MPRTKRDTTKSLNLQCDDSSDSFVVRYTNRGEPFPQGISIGVENDEFDKAVVVVLEKYEAKELRDLLLKLYPISTCLPECLKNV